MKSAKELIGMNETATILFLLILAVWFFTNNRFQALLDVIKAPISSGIYSGPVITLPKDSPIPGLVVPAGTTANSPGVHDNPNPGGNPNLKP